MEISRKYIHLKQYIHKTTHLQNYFCKREIQTPKTDKVKKVHIERHNLPTFVDNSTLTII